MDGLAYDACDQGGRLAEDRCLHNSKNDLFLMPLSLRPVVLEAPARKLFMLEW